MKKYLIYVSLIIVVVIIFFKNIYVPKHTFETTHAKQENMPVRVNGLGNIGSKEIYKIGTVYGGKVSSFNVEEGSFIHKGDLIAKIDSIDLNAKILEQIASVNKIKSDIKGLKLDADSAQISYLYQEDIFKKNHKLFIKGAISDLDHKKFKTNRTVAKLQVRSIASKIKSLDALILQMKANIKGLKERLARYTIYSPVDGYITKKLISNFAIINPNQTLIEIVNPKDVWIETHVDTRISGDVKLGDKASIKLRSSEKIFEGQVSKIKPINNSVTNEREIDISFDTLPIPFYLEEQAKVSIDIKLLKDIVKIPKNALTIYNQKDGVWILEDGKIHFKVIKILIQDKDGGATRDISTSDILVIPNPKNKNLKDGMKIYND